MEAVGSEPAGPSPAGSVSYRIVWDDFRNGFSVGPQSRWSYPESGSYVADDGIVTTSENGLSVRSRGVNPHSGDPAFIRTLGQEGSNGSPLPGLLDHVKWLVYANHQASTGYQGFDAKLGGELSCETWMSGRTYGTAGHPFGALVPHPDDDLRLASVVVSAFDPETNLVLDFFLTNETIYAFYERLPGVRETLGNYAAFSSMIPVASRSPEARHHLRIAYDRSAGSARWLVDGKQVYRVDRLGMRPDRRYLTLDHGGVETLVQPRQLSFGMGMLSLLDGALPNRSPGGLVRLSGAESLYFDPVVGEPKPQSFSDDESLESNRLFGQGAELDMSYYVISHGPDR